MNVRDDDDAGKDEVTSYRGISLTRWIDLSI
jgi:hypothetical protein